MDKQRLRAFLLGGAAGLLAGVILAPRSGRELRGSIADRAGEAREMSRETLFEAQERLQERRAAVREGSHRRARSADSDAGSTVDAEVNPLSPGEAAPRGPTSRRARLREVPRDLAADAPGASAGPETAPPETERSDELRRKVRETRARLRERLDGPGGGGAGDPGDPGAGR